MLKLWGRDTSVNVQKVLWALDELGLDYERIDVGGAFGGLDTPEYAKLNPNRKIPVLEDGDFSLWESGAIVRYLAKAHGNGHLLPKDVKQQALANQWSNWCQNTIYADFIGKIFQQIVRVTAAERDNDGVAQAAKRLGTAFQILDQELDGTDFIVGDNLTYADIEIGGLMHRYFTIPIERPALPNVEAWTDRLKTRPAYQEHIKKDWTLMKIPGA